MLGILVLLAISWIGLYLFEKKNILALGFLPFPKRLKQFIIGFSFAAGLCVLVVAMETGLSEARWVVNPKFSFTKLGEAFLWDFRSVFFEELVFRGALLYILIKRIGPKPAVWLSASAFGVYHWFSFGILGQPVPMLIVFLGTGIMGFAWALAFSKTRSVIWPFALHLGWNFTNNTVFSKGPLGELVLVARNGHAFSDWYSLVGMILVPILILFFVAILIPKEETIPSPLQHAS